MRGAFLESEFIGEDTSAMTFRSQRARRRPARLRLRAGTCPAADPRLFPDGRNLRVRRPARAGRRDRPRFGLRPPDLDRQHGRLPRRLYEGAPARRNLGGRLCHGRPPQRRDPLYQHGADKSDDSLAYLICAQVEPSTRILYFSASGSTPDPLHLTAADAKRLAAGYLTEVMSFSNQAVDAGAFTCTPTMPAALGGCATASSTAT